MTDNNPIEEKPEDTNRPDIPIEGAQQEPVEHGADLPEPQQEPATSHAPAAEVQKKAETNDTAGNEVRQKPDSAKTTEEEVNPAVDASGTSQKAQPEKQAVKNTEVVGVRFRSCGKVYTFDANNLELASGNRVVVDSEMGLSMGYVVAPKHIRKNPRDSFKKVIRLASEKDFETIESNRSLQEEAKAFCVKKSKELNLQMKVVTTEITLDKKRLIFYFTADGRIDFRELVRDLAAKFKTRIEMRQIGVRDEVKMLGGIGACGRQTCCNQFLTSFAPITIRMAKQQALSINQSKLSGICGRLMCCLGYEYHDGPVEEIVKDKPVKTDTPDKQEEPVQKADSSSAGPDRPQRPRTSTETRRQPRPQQKEQKDTTEEKRPERKRPDSRRRRRRRGGKAPRDNSGQQVKPDTQQQVTQKPAEAGEKKTTGRPGNKRKRFWKKKKKKEE